MLRIWGDKRLEAAKWAQATQGVYIDPTDKFVALVLADDIAIKAAVFYNNWQPGNSVLMHIAAIPGRRWLTRPFLAAAFRYPFLQLGVRRVGGEILASNAPSLRFARHIGFVDEGIQREAGPGGQDVIAMGMLRRECRWLAGPPPQIWGNHYGEAESADPSEPDRDHSGAGSGEQPKRAANR
jgi:RimJ/RimL family protein N-acetyltransferase